MAIPFTPKDLRKSMKELLEILGEENGVVYSDGIPVLKIRRYSVTQATPIVEKTVELPKHDVTQPKKTLIKGRGWVVLDADGNPMPEWD